VLVELKVVEQRYYDIYLDQFMSVDPMVETTGQPSGFTGDDPLNATDPLGLISAGTVCGQHGSKSNACEAAIKTSKKVTKAECRNDPGACGKYTCGHFAIGCLYPLGLAILALTCVVTCPEAGAAAADAISSCSAACRAAAKFAAAESALGAAHAAVDYEQSRDTDPNTLPLYQFSNDLLNVFDGLDIASDINEASGGH
jgi:hypothetical protein